jgi:branched-chain amino acid transport system ATP-binding protein
MSAVLECRDLEAGYGAGSVVRGVSFSLAGGSVLGVLGPNGAGKTTMLMAMAGLIPLTGGQVLLDGNPLPKGRPSRANQAGLILVPDDRSLFMTLTVRENLEVARRRSRQPAESMIELFPLLGTRWNLSAGSLSGGEQQMLAVARAVIQQPRVLLIDEMSMGLAPIVVESLIPLVRRVADQSGAVVVLVEQHVRLALEVSDRAIVLVHGEVVLSGTGEQLRNDPDSLEAAYFGIRRDGDTEPAV